MEINQTRSFLLLGFTEDPDLQPLFFGMFLSLYVDTFAGNLAIILAIISDPPPPHPHVLLSLQPVICRHRFHLHNHPKDAMEHPDIEQRYHL